MRKLTRFVGLSLMGLVLAACGDSDPVPLKPVSESQMGEFGTEVPEGVLVSKKYKPMWMQHVVMGYSKETARAVPKKIDALSTAKTCDVKLPKRGTKVAHVSADRGGKFLPLQTVTTKNFSLDLQAVVNATQKADKIISYSDLKGGQSHSVIDVFVTDKTRPIYLLLTSQNSVIWNVQLDRGVKLENIVVFSNGVAGLANLESEYPVQVFDAKRLSDCRIRPTRDPKESWGFVRSVGQSEELRDRLFKMQANFGNYAKWFKQTFGFALTKDLFNYGRVDHILVGDLPVSADYRITYQPVSEFTLGLTKAGVVYPGDVDSFNKFYRELLITQASKLTGLDASKVLQD